jgi:hypothetical protein
LSRCHPDGDFASATSPDDYERRVNAATHSPNRHAIYFGRGYDDVDATFVEKAFDFVNSPFSVKLSNRFDSAVYPKAAIHLFRFAKGENQSLRHLSQDDAWEAISRQPGNPISWLKMKGGIR